LPKYTQVSLATPTSSSFEEPHDLRFRQRIEMQIEADDRRRCVGQYANASDYIGHLIRDDRKRRERLVRALIEGEESGLSRRTVRGIIADAKSTVGGVSRS
jgi:Arc/MetJ-type ribon-helix-helix transcriptional regulator